MFAFDTAALYSGRITARVACQFSFELHFRLSVRPPSEIPNLASLRTKFGGSSRQTHHPAKPGRFYIFGLVEQTHRVCFGLALATGISLSCLDIVMVCTGSSNSHGGALILIFSWCLTKIIWKALIFDNKLILSRRFISSGLIFPDEVVRDHCCVLKSRYNITKRNYVCKV